jgi:NAD(P)H-hydrate epimerase
VARRTLTLALPKTGLAGVEGDIYLADIGIPPAVYARIGLQVEIAWESRYWLRLSTRREKQ